MSILPSVAITASRRAWKRALRSCTQASSPSRAAIEAIWTASKMPLSTFVFTRPSASTATRLPTIIPERQQVGLAVCQQRSDAVDGIAGVGHEDNVAGVHERGGDVGDALLRPDQWHDLAVGVERHLEAALVPASNGGAELGQPVVIGVPMAAGIGHRLLRRLHDVGWARKVRIADAEADDVEAGCALLGDSSIHLGEQIGRQILDAARGADRRGACFSAQRALPTALGSSGFRVASSESGSTPDSES